MKSGYLPRNILIHLSFILSMQDSFENWWGSNTRPQSLLFFTIPSLAQLFRVKLRNILEVKLPWGTQISVQFIFCTSYISISSYISKLDILKSSHHKMSKITGWNMKSSTDCMRGWIYETTLGFFWGWEPSLSSGIGWSSNIEPAILWAPSNPRWPGGLIL